MCPSFLLARIGNCRGTPTPCGDRALGGAANSGAANTTNLGNVQLTYRCHLFPCHEPSYD
jgi:hypothetical protein